MSRFLVMVLVCVVEGELLPQSPDEFRARVEVVRSTLIDPKVDATTVQALRAEAAGFRPALIARQSQWSNVDVAMAWIAVHHLELATSVESDGPPALDELEKELWRRGGRRDGWCLLLNERSGEQHLRGDVIRTGDAWDELQHSFTDAKRFWIAIEAARVQINLCRDPARGEAILDAALADLEATKPWDEAERAVLAKDRDFYLTDVARPLAASWRDTRGHLRLLRGFARTSRGAMVQAIADLTLAREDFLHTGNEHRQVNCDHSLASVWLQLGRYDDAVATAASARLRYHGGLPVLRTAERVRDDNGVVAMTKVEAQARTRRGALGDVDEAEKLFRSLETAKFLAWPGETNVDALVDHAELLLLPEIPTERRTSFASLLDAVRAYFGKNIDHLLGWRVELLDAESRLQRGDFAGAKAIVDRSKSGVLRLGNLSLSVAWWSLHARLSSSAGDPAAALDAWWQAAQVVQRAVLTEGIWRLGNGTSTCIAQFDGVLKGAHEAVRTLLATGKSAGVLEKLYEICQRFHGLDALCRMTAGGDPTVSPLSDAAQAQGQKLRDVDRQLSTLLAKPPANPREVRDRDAHRAELEKQKQALEDSVAAINASQRVVQAIDPAKLPIVQAALQPGELLVECVDAGETAFAFAIERDAVRLIDLPAEPAWNHAIAGLQKWIVGTDEETDVTRVPALRAVAERLFGESSALAKCIATDDVKHLCWSPEGSFGAVPLAALPFRGEPLVRRMGISMHVSGTMLVRERSRAPRPRDTLRLFAVANPRYPPPQLAALRMRSWIGGAFPQLPATAGEAIAIAKGFATVAERQRLDALGDPSKIDDVLTGDRYRVALGSKARGVDVVPANVRDFQVLHFACHGETRVDAPAMSFLALTLDADGSDGGGLLHPSDFASLDGDFELVVLSACGTAVGTRDGHDGVAGLAWAAQVGGARRVVATLWQVPDTSTATMMTSFYEKWRRDGMPAAQALVEVQRAAIGRLPVHTWAPFVMWGDAR